MKTTGKTKNPKTPVPAAAGRYQANLTTLNRTALPALHKVKVPPHRWGGTRDGAGRKPTGRQPVLLRLTPATVRSLRTAARRLGKSISDVAEDRLARS